jgi:hypothetical protein
MCGFCNVWLCHDYHWGESARRKFINTLQIGTFLFQGIVEANTKRRHLFNTLRYGMCSEGLKVTSNCRVGTESEQREGNCKIG